MCCDVKDLRWVLNSAVWKTVYHRGISPKPVWHRCNYVITVDIGKMKDDYSLFFPLNLSRSTLDPAFAPTVWDTVPLWIAPVVLGALLLVLAIGSILHYNITVKAKVIAISSECRKLDEEIARYKDHPEPPPQHSMLNTNRTRHMSVQKIPGNGLPKFPLPMAKDPQLNIDTSVKSALDISYNFPCAAIIEEDEYLKSEASSVHSNSRTENETLCSSPGGIQVPPSPARSSQHSICSADCLLSDGTEQLTEQPLQRIVAYTDDERRRSSPEILQSSVC